MLHSERIIMLDDSTKLSGLDRLFLSIPSGKCFFQFTAEGRITFTERGIVETQWKIYDYLIWLNDKLVPIAQAGKLRHPASVPEYRNLHGNLICTQNYPAPFNN